MIEHEMLDERLALVRQRLAANGWTEVGGRWFWRWGETRTPSQKARIPMLYLPGAHSGVEIHGHCDEADAAELFRSLAAAFEMGP